MTTDLLYHLCCNTLPSVDNAARAEIEARYSMEAMASAYLAVYDQVLKTNTKNNLCAA